MNFYCPCHKELGNCRKMDRTMMTCSINKRKQWCVVCNRQGVSFWHKCLVSCDLQLPIIVSGVNKNGEGPTFRPAWKGFLAQLLLLPLILVIQAVLNIGLVMVAYINHMKREIDYKSQVCCRCFNCFYKGLLWFYHGFSGLFLATYGIPLFAIAAFFKYVINFVN